MLMTTPILAWNVALRELASTPGHLGWPGVEAIREWAWDLDEELGRCAHAQCESAARHMCLKITAKTGAGC